jgi:inner membrane protein
MPTVMTHAAVALALGRLATGGRPMPARFWLSSAALAMLPDLDVLAWPLGLPYASLWSHRGLTHSLPTAAVIALGAAALARVGVGVGRAWLYFFAVVASHGVLDAMTNGGAGVAFFAPFDATRYFLPWRPVEVSPIGPAFFGRRGLETIESELVWIWLPTALVVGAAALWRRGRAPAPRRPEEG